MARGRLVICRNRLERADNLQRFEARLSQGESERQVAAELGMARSTLREWRAERSVQEAPQELAAFAATPDGSSRPRA
jgi:hypothetical protein